jgi:hypothetical protein
MPATHCGAKTSRAAVIDEGYKKGYKKGTFLLHLFDTCEFV